MSRPIKATPVLSYKEYVEFLNKLIGNNEKEIINLKVEVKKCRKKRELL